MTPVLVILAAGIGSRYGGLKQIDQIGPSGEAIIDYSIYDAIRAGIEKVVFIIRRNIEKDMREVFDEKLRGKIGVDYVYQELEMIPGGYSSPPGRKKPWGTAHAVWTARNAVKAPFLVINADDYYGPGSYRKTVEYLAGMSRDSKSYCMVGYQVRHTLSDYGSVSRGLCEADRDNNLRAVVEVTEIEKQDGRILYKDPEGRQVDLRGDEIVSMNIWGFTPAIFPAIEEEFTHFLAADHDLVKAEIYIPTVINNLVAGGSASVRILPASDRWFGITYRDDKPLAEEFIGQLVKEGTYPENLWTYNG
jgi:UTP-glucose-1-phosphate uridylyltransferase